MGCYSSVQSTVQDSNEPNQLNRHNRKHTAIFACLLIPLLLAFSVFATNFYIMLPNRKIGIMAVPKYLV